MDVVCVGCDLPRLLKSEIVKSLGAKQQQKMVFSIFKFRKTENFKLKSLKTLEKSFAYQTKFLCLISLKCAQL